MTQWLNLLADMIQHNLWIAPVLCVAAGVITSFTPCSLSSIPMIIAYISGSAKQDTQKAFRLSLTMAAGLSLTFIVFGSLASVIGHLMHEIGKWWYVFLGLVMVLMALQIWNVIHLIPEHFGPGKKKEEDACRHGHIHTHADHRSDSGLQGGCDCGHDHGMETDCGCAGEVQVKRTGKRGYAGAFTAGILSGAFASHCATPVMIALLAIAAQSGSTFWGIFLLALYAVGHSFLLIAAGTSYSLVEKWMYDPKYEKISAVLRKVMGAVILCIGFAMIYMAFFYEA